VEREKLANNALRVIQPHREAAARTAVLIEKSFVGHALPLAGISQTRSP